MNGGYQNKNLSIKDHLKHLVKIIKEYFSVNFFLVTYLAPIFCHPGKNKILEMAPAVQTEEREEEVEVLDDSEFGPLSISKLEVIKTSEIELMR